MVQLTVQSESDQGHFKISALKWLINCEVALPSVGPMPFHSSHLFRLWRVALQQKLVFKGPPIKTFITI